jgi:Flp pilus assembly secretin CpaC
MPSSSAALGIGSPFSTLIIVTMNNIAEDRFMTTMRSKLRHVMPVTLLMVAGSMNLNGVQAAPQAIDPNAVVVTIDHAKIVRLPEKVQTVVVGNPIVADVTVQRNGILVVTGKSYGTTNLIALDSTGNMLVETSIRVQASNDTMLTVHRGLERESYSCSPTCQPSLLLGDAQRYFSDVSGQATQRNTLATQR